MKKIILLASVMALFSIQNAQAIGNTATQTTNIGNTAWTNPGTQTTLTCATTGKPGPCPNAVTNFVAGEYELKEAITDWTIPSSGGGESTAQNQISGNCPEGTSKSSDGCCCINN